MAQELRKAELIAELARARETTAAGLHGLRDDLNIVRRIETAVRRHRLAWLAGAALFGFLLAKLPARTKKVVVPRMRKKPDEKETIVKAGLLVTVLKLAFDIARPALTKWLTRRVTAYAVNRFGRT